MEASGTGIGRLDCYEDMFKEITRKLYGDDPDHRTSNVQNEFEASVTFKTEEAFKTDEDEAVAEASDDATSWILDDEPLKGSDGSRVAAYRPLSSTWRCYECGDCMPGGAREMAEHFMDLHAPRLDDGGGGLGRNRMQRKDYLGPSDFKLEEIVAYLEKLRERGDRLGALPTRRTQETQTVPAVLLPVTSSFLLQELPSTPPQQLLQPQPQQQQQQQHHQQANPVTIAPTTRSSTAVTSAPVAASVGAGGGRGNNSSGKRYTCLYCPYGTDRRDLYTRHENIHREEKPFHCYVCGKPFSRADHVKKHFLRMHREHTYELSRIRRPAGSTSSPSSSSSSPSSPVVLKQTQQITASIQPATPTTTYQHQHSTSNNLHANALYQAASLSSAVVAAANIIQPLVEAPTIVAPVQQPRKLQNAASKSQLKASSGSSSTKNQERRYTCCYCSWSGVDNWCLKRHLNTHLKPFACALCEYKAARAERLATHVLKVHNRRQCSRCSFLAEDLAQLQVHQLHVHRVSNPGSATATVAVAATVTSAATTPQQQTATTIAQQQQQSQSNEQHQSQSLNVGASGGGRAPPGPPVFPASSAAIAPATTAIPPTTILGTLASTPGSGCWEQETSSCEARFQRTSSCKVEHRRSRKQSQPRKVMTSHLEMPLQLTETTPLQVLQSQTVKPTAKLLRCYQCPKRSSARAKAYHSKVSLLLHKMWRHSATRRRRRRGRGGSVVPITLKATVVTRRASHSYQR